MICEYKSQNNMPLMYEAARKRTIYFPLTELIVYIYLYIFR